MTDGPKVVDTPDEDPRGPLDDYHDARDGIELTAEEFTVHAREKISTGDYENAEYHTTISGSVGGDGRLDAETRRELKARLLSVHKEAQATVERAAENRIREPGHDDWGVPKNGGDDG